MAKLPARRERRSPTPPDTGQRTARVPDEYVPAGSVRMRGFAFRYSHTEISAIGGSASVKHSETRYENGKLTSESFEGSFDRGSFDEWVRRANEHILKQSALLMRSLLGFLPAPRERHDRD